LLCVPYTQGRRKYSCIPFTQVERILFTPNCKRMETNFIFGYMGR
jgi:hypothetical protein